METGPAGPVPQTLPGEVARNEGWREVKAARQPPNGRVAIAAGEPGR